MQRTHSTHLSFHVMLNHFNIGVVSSGHAFPSTQGCTVGRVTSHSFTAQFTCELMEHALKFGQVGCWSLSCSKKGWVEGKRSLTFFSSFFPQEN